MSMGSIDPAGRRKSDKGVGEVDEDINETPVPQGVGVTVRAALCPFVVLVAALHVMANKEARAEGGLVVRKGHAAGVEGKVEGVQVA